ncbi:hypothetical protein E1295_06975 [Nonomuraea mesophila]|uniref:Uncharacterized protein n=1 Tax=Nonomuraea mesophila TaxID=2530382 RepID=A0A4R5FUT0_9ACTN|nr:hypothetical protein [Nonomuraea mesophila]TDE57706.1 hypothetical protein E1295_06975 [Nonomuraea mesophila]
MSGKLDPRSPPGCAAPRSPAWTWPSWSRASPSSCDGRRRRLSPRSVNTIVAEIGAIHDLQVQDADRQLGALLERRLGHANERYLKLYTNPPEEIAAGYVEDL